MRPLGKDQEMALDALQRYGVWPGGWYLANTSKTVRVLESLVRRGLVVTYEIDDRHNGGSITHYQIKRERK